MTFIEVSVSYWNSCAEELAQQRTLELSGDDADIWAKMLSGMLPKNRPLTILDVGTGSGFLAVILSRLGHNVIGVDLSPVMIQCAYETAARFRRRIEYRIMDADALDFPDESFDAVVSCGLTGCLDNASKAYSEWFRVLKKGGLLASFEQDDVSSLAPIETPESGSWKAALESTGSCQPPRPQRELDLLRSCGFAHCRARSGLLPQDITGAFCITAHKSASERRAHIPQLLQFNHHLKTAKLELQLYQNWCQENGISHTDYLVLHMITHHAGGARPSDIAGALVIPRQTLTRILGNLERDGLISRKTNEDDRRSTFIQITPEGSERFAALHDSLHAIEEKALLQFTPDELSLLCSFGDRLLGAFETAFGQDAKA